MSNTMKIIVFIIFMFAFLLFFTIINFIIAVDSFLIKALLYILSYIAVLYIQALIKYLYTRNMMKNSQIINILPGKYCGIRDRIILLILPLVAVLMPIVNKKTVTRENLWSLAAIAVLGAILEALLYINGKTMKIYVTGKGFAILGIDLRLELSIPFSYTNAAGWYPFERIENYLGYNSNVLLYPSYDMGVIDIECAEDEIKQIIGLLKANGVPERRYK